MSAVEDELGTLLAALQVLHSSSTRQQKEKAHNYLEAFQKKSTSWTPVLRLLKRDSTAGVEVKIFAAQTLRSKIKYDFHQVTPENREALKNNLLDLLIVYSGGPRPILIQICVSIAALGMQLKSWTTVVLDVVAVCQTAGNSEDALLQFLAVLPEEVSDHRRMILTDEELEERTQVLLRNNSDKVLDLLMRYAASQAFQTNPRPLIFTCLSSWLREIPIAKIVDSPLRRLAFQSLGSDELFDSAVDFVVAMLREVRDANDNPDPLYEELVLLGSRLEDLEQDPDTFRGLTRIYTEAGEMWTVLIARTPERYQYLVHCMAQCTRYHEDLDVTKITFNFWYELTQLITVEKYRPAKELFTPIYEGLVQTMILHLHYPDGNDRDDIFSGDRDAEDKFRDFRHEMGDVLKDCCRVIGGSRCLAAASAEVQRCLREQALGVAVRWQDIEAPLFSMRMMAREIDTNENQVVPEVMALLVNLPDHDKIRYAATLVLGRYTEWTANHPDYLEFQLNYISTGFENQNREVISAAAQALKHFCQDCKRHLVNHVGHLLPFYQNVASALDRDALFEVTEGVAHVVAAQPLDRIYEIMGSFCRPIANELDQYQRLAPTDDEKILRKLADLIELLTIFVQTVSPYVDPQQPHPAVQLVQELWPYVYRTLAAFGQHQMISEAVAKHIKNIIYSYRIHCLPLLPALADVLVESFGHYKYGCFLWASGALVRQFGHEEIPAATRQAIWEFVDRQCRATFVILELKKPNEIPDLTEDFFRLLMDALYCHPLEFSRSALLPWIMLATLSSLSSELENPLTAVLHFLRDLLGYTVGHIPSAMQSEVPAEMQTILRELVVNNGPILCTALVSGMIFTFPSDCVMDGAGALMTLIEANPSAAANWIAQSLDALPQEHLSLEERHRFLAQIQGSASHRDYRRIQRQIQDFIAIYRRRVISPRHKGARRGMFEGVVFHVPT